VKVDKKPRVKKTTKKVTKKSPKVLPAGKKGILFHVGNLFIVLSLLITFVVFYPVVNTYLFPKEVIASSELEGDYNSFFILCKIRRRISGA